VRRGKSGNGSVQVDASYPLRKPFFADTGGYVHFQYFNGYGETILDYNLRRSPQFRVGFSIVR
jgi:outer membrane phospholipase A